MQRCPRASGGRGNRSQSRNFCPLFHHAAENDCDFALPHSKYGSRQPIQRCQRMLDAIIIIYHILDANSIVAMRFLHNTSTVPGKYTDFLPPVLITDNLIKNRPYREPAVLGTIYNKRPISYLFYYCFENLEFVKNERT